MPFVVGSVSGRGIYPLTGLCERVSPLLYTSRGVGLFSGSQMVVTLMVRLTVVTGLRKQEVEKIM